MSLAVYEYKIPYLIGDPSNYQMTDYRSSDVMTRCLMLSSRAAITQEQVFALFDIIPGMDYCELQRDAYGLSKGWSSSASLDSLIDQTVSVDVFVGKSLCLLVSVCW